MKIEISRAEVRALIDAVQRMTHAVSYPDVDDIIKRYDLTRYEANMLIEAGKTIRAAYDTGEA